MYRFGTTPAIRKSTSDIQQGPMARGAFLGSALRMMRSTRQQKRMYQESSRMFRRNPRLFSLDDLEFQFLRSLLNQGHAMAPAFFSKDLVDRIYTKADGIFNNFAADERSVLINSSECTPQGKRMRDGSAIRERTIELIDPLVCIPEVLDIVFHESILKSSAHFLQHIPRLYKVSIVRHFPNHRPICLTRSQQETDRHDCLNIIIDLLDMDGTHGLLVYLPSKHNCLTFERNAPRESDISGSDRKRVPYMKTNSARSKWVVLRGDRGTIVAVSGGGDRGSVWTYPGDVNNKPRTSLRIQISGYKAGDLPAAPQNRILKWNFDRMTELQQMFAYPGLVDDPTPGFARVG
jgi:hypothetical protein